MTRDGGVIASLLAGLSGQIATEARQARLELLKDNRLSLDFAYLLSDDP